MRILLDECVPKRLKHEFSAHEVWTVPEMGWAGTKNGALLCIAAEHFDVLLTTDRNLVLQQNLVTVRLGIIVLHAPSNDIVVLLPLVSAVRDALASVRAGAVIHVGLAEA
jgi:hypothetical protein